MTIAVVTGVGVLLLAAGLLALRRPTPPAPAASVREPDYRAHAVLGARTATGWVEREAIVACRGGRRSVAVEDGETRVEPPTLDAEALRGTYVTAERTGPVLLGRPTVETVVTRKGAAVPSLVLAADAETGAILRREACRADGSLASRLELTSIDYGLATESLPSPAESGGDEPASPDDLRGYAGISPVEPTDLPTGYRLEGLYRAPSGHARGYAEFRYTDGLRTLSVYERAAGGPTAQESGGPRRGRGAGRGRGGPPEVGRPQVTDIGIALSARQRRGGLIVLVVGDVTPDEAIRVLESIEPE